MKGEEGGACLCDRGDVSFEHRLCADMSHEFVLDLDEGVDEVAPCLETDEDADDCFRGSRGPPCASPVEGMGGLAETLLPVLDGPECLEHVSCDAMDEPSDLV